MEYLLLVLAVSCIAVQFNVNKVYQKKFVYGLKDMLFFPFICGVVNIITFTILGFIQYGGLPAFSVFSFFMSVILAVVSTLCAITGILIMKYGRMSAYSVYMMLGGMILPYFYGVIFLDESLTAARIIGLAILICALPFSAINPKKNGEHSEKIKQPKFFYILCVFIFILNGCNSIVSKAHSINSMAIPEVNFIFYVNLWQMIINGAAFFIFTAITRDSYKQENIRQTASNKIQKILTIAVYAVISGTALLLLLISAKTVPAVALYPFVTGGSIVLSVTAARIFLKEKISAPALVGIILAFGGTLLFLIN